jgi:hypothetical protein
VEHYVLNELHAARQTRDIRYWRDKQGHEIDFVLGGRDRSPTAIECKWTAADFSPDNLRIFRRRYPGGANPLVTADTARPYARRFGELDVRIIGVADVHALPLSPSR